MSNRHSGGRSSETSSHPIDFIIIIIIINNNKQLPNCKIVYRFEKMAVHPRRLNFIVYLDF
jgi:hypothetical protein